MERETQDMKQTSSKLLIKRLRKVKFFCILFQAVPFIRCIILNGSLASGDIKPSSDIDLLIIAKDGRIYTTRFIINVIATLLGQKRLKDESKGHAGKFCFNYFMTTSYLKIPTGRGVKMDHYCAENYSKSVLVLGDRAIFKRFFNTNQTLFLSSQTRSGIQKQGTGSRIKCGMTIKNKWIINQREMTEDFPVKRTILLLVSLLQELILGGWLGDKLEQILKRIQIKKFESDPRTKKYQNLIVYNDKELRFHPPKVQKD